MPSLAKAFVSNKHCHNPVCYSSHLTCPLFFMWRLVATVCFLRTRCLFTRSRKRYAQFHFAIERFKTATGKPEVVTECRNNITNQRTRSVPASVSVSSVWLPRFEDFSMTSDEVFFFFFKLLRTTRLKALKKMQAFYIGHAILLALVLIADAMPDDSELENQCVPALSLGKSAVPQRKFGMPQQAFAGDLFSKSSRVGLPKMHKVTKDRTHTTLRQVRKLSTLGAGCFSAKEDQLQKMNRKGSTLEAHIGELFPSLLCIDLNDLSDPREVLIEDCHIQDGLKITSTASVPLTYSITIRNSHVEVTGSGSLADDGTLSAITFVGVLSASGSTLTITGNTIENFDNTQSSLFDGPIYGVHFDAMSTLHYVDVSFTSNTLAVAFFDPGTGVGPSKVSAVMINADFSYSQMTIEGNDIVVDGWTSAHFFDVEMPNDIIEAHVNVLLNTVQCTARATEAVSRFFFVFGNGFSIADSEFVASQNAADIELKDYGENNFATIHEFAMTRSTFTAESNLIHLYGIVSLAQAFHQIILEMSESAIVLIDNAVNTEITYADPPTDATPHVSCGLYHNCPRHSNSCLQVHLNIWTLTAVEQAWGIHFDAGNDFSDDLEIEITSNTISLESMTIYGVWGYRLCDGAYLLSRTNLIEMNGFSVYQDIGIGDQFFASGIGFEIVESSAVDIIENDIFFSGYDVGDPTPCGQSDLNCIPNIHQGIGFFDTPQSMINVEENNIDMELLQWTSGHETIGVAFRSSARSTSVYTVSRNFMTISAKFHATAVQFDNGDSCTVIMEGNDLDLVSTTDEVLYNEYPGACALRFSSSEPYSDVYFEGNVGSLSASSSNFGGCRGVVLEDVASFAELIFQDNVLDFSGSDVGGISAYNLGDSATFFASNNVIHMRGTGAPDVGPDSTFSADGIHLEWLSNGFVEIEGNEINFDGYYGGDPSSCGCNIAVHAGIDLWFVTESTTVNVIENTILFDEIQWLHDNAVHGILVGGSAFDPASKLWTASFNITKNTIDIIAVFRTNAVHFENAIGGGTSITVQLNAIHLVSTATNDDVVTYGGDPGSEVIAFVSCVRDTTIVIDSNVMSVVALGGMIANFGCYFLMSSLEFTHNAVEIFGDSSFDTFTSVGHAFSGCSGYGSTWEGSTYVVSHNIAVVEACHATFWATFLTAVFQCSGTFDDNTVSVTAFCDCGYGIHYDVPLIEESRIEVTNTALTVDGAVTAAGFVAQNGGSGSTLIAEYSFVGNTFGISAAEVAAIIVHRVTDGSSLTIESNNATLYVNGGDPFGCLGGQLGVFSSDETFGSQLHVRHNNMILTGVFNEATNSAGGITFGFPSGSDVVIEGNTAYISVESPTPHNFLAFYGFATDTQLSVRDNEVSVHGNSAANGIAAWLSSSPSITTVTGNTVNVSCANEGCEAHGLLSTIGSFVNIEANDFTVLSKGCAMGVKFESDEHAFANVSMTNTSLTVHAVVSAAGFASAYGGAGSTSFVQYTFVGNTFNISAAEVAAIIVDRVTDDSSLTIESNIAFVNVNGGDPFGCLDGNVGVFRTHETWESQLYVRHNNMILTGVFNEVNDIASGITFGSPTLSDIVVQGNNADISVDIPTPTNFLTIFGDATDVQLAVRDNEVSVHGNSAANGIAGFFDPSSSPPTSTIVTGNTVNVSCANEGCEAHGLLSTIGSFVNIEANDFTVLSKGCAAGVKFESNLLLMFCTVSMTNTALTVHGAVTGIGFASFNFEFEAFSIDFTFIDNTFDISAAEVAAIFVQRVTKYSLLTIEANNATLYVNGGDPFGCLDGQVSVFRCEETWLSELHVRHNNMILTGVFNEVNDIASGITFGTPKLSDIVVEDNTAYIAVDIPTPTNFLTIFGDADDTQLSVQNNQVSVHGMNGANGFAGFQDGPLAVAAFNGNDFNISCANEGCESRGIATPCVGDIEALRNNISVRAHFYSIGVFFDGQGFLNPSVESNRISATGGASQCIQLINLGPNTTASFSHNSFVAATVEAQNIPAVDIEGPSFCGSRLLFHEDLIVTAGIGVSLKGGIRCTIPEGQSSTVSDLVTPFCFDFETKKTVACISKGSTGADFTFSAKGIVQLEPAQNAAIAYPKIAFEDLFTEDLSGMAFNTAPKDFVDVAVVRSDLGNYFKIQFVETDGTTLTFRWAPVSDAPPPLPPEPVDNFEMHFKDVSGQMTGHPTFLKADFEMLPNCKVEFDGVRVWTTGGASEAVNLSTNFAPASVVSPPPCNRLNGVAWNPLRLIVPGQPQPMCSMTVSPSVTLSIEPPETQTHTASETVDATESVQPWTRTQTPSLKATDTNSLTKSIAWSMQHINWVDVLCNNSAGLLNRGEVMKCILSVGVNFTGNRGIGAAMRLFIRTTSGVSMFLSPGTSPISSIIDEVPYDTKNVSFRVKIVVDPFAQLLNDSVSFEVTGANAYGNSGGAAAITMHAIRTPSVKPVTIVWQADSDDPSSACCRPLLQNVEVPVAWFDTSVSCNESLLEVLHMIAETTNMSYQTFEGAFEEPCINSSKNVHFSVADPILADGFSTNIEEIHHASTEDIVSKMHHNEPLPIDDVNANSAAVFDIVLMANHSASGAMNALAALLNIYANGFHAVDVVSDFNGVERVRIVVTETVTASKISLLGPSTFLSVGIADIQAMPPVVNPPYFDVVVGSSQTIDNAIATLGLPRDAFQVIRETTSASNASQTEVRVAVSEAGVAAMLQLLPASKLLDARVEFVPPTSNYIDMQLPGQQTTTESLRILAETLNVSVAVFEIVQDLPSANGSARDVRIAVVGDPAAATKVQLLARSSLLAVGISSLHAKVDDTALFSATLHEGETVADVLANLAAFLDVPSDALDVISTEQLSNGTTALQFRVKNAPAATKLQDAERQLLIRSSLLAAGISKMHAAPAMVNYFDADLLNFETAENAIVRLSVLLNVTVAEMEIVYTHPNQDGSTSVRFGVANKTIVDKFELLDDSALSTLLIAKKQLGAAHEWFSVPLQCNQSIDGAIASAVLNVSRNAVREVLEEPCIDGTKQVHFSFTDPAISESITRRIEDSRAAQSSIMAVLGIHRTDAVAQSVDWVDLRITANLTANESLKILAEVLNVPFDIFEIVQDLPSDDGSSRDVQIVVGDRAAATKVQLLARPTLLAAGIASLHAVADDAAVPKTIFNATLNEGETVADVLANLAAFLDVPSDALDVISTEQLSNGTTALQFRVKDAPAATKLQDTGLPYLLNLGIADLTAVPQGGAIPSHTPTSNGSGGRWAVKLKDPQAASEAIILTVGPFLASLQPVKDADYSSVNVHDAPDFVLTCPSGVDLLLHTEEQLDNWINLLREEDRIVMNVMLSNKKKRSEIVHCIVDHCSTTHHKSTLHASDFLLALKDERGSLRSICIALLPFEPRKLQGGEQADTVELESKIPVVSIEAGSSNKIRTKLQRKIRATDYTYRALSAFATTGPHAKATRNNESVDAVVVSSTFQCPPNNDFCVMIVEFEVVIASLPSDVGSAEYSFVVEGYSYNFAVAVTHPKVLVSAYTGPGVFVSRRRQLSRTTYVTVNCNGSQLLDVHVVTQYDEQTMISADVRSFDASCVVSNFVLRCSNNSVKCVNSNSTSSWKFSFVSYLPEYFTANASVVIRAWSSNAIQEVEYRHFVQVRESFAAGVNASTGAPADPPQPSVPEDAQQQVVVRGVFSLQSNGGLHFIVYTIIVYFCVSVCQILYKFWCEATHRSVEVDTYQNVSMTTKALKSHVLIGFLLPCHFHCAHVHTTVLAVSWLTMCAAAGIGLEFVPSGVSDAVTVLVVALGASVIQVVVRPLVEHFFYVKKITVDQKSYDALLTMVAPQCLASMKSAVQLPARLKPSQNSTRGLEEVYFGMPLEDDEGSQEQKPTAPAIESAPIENDENDLSDTKVTGRIHASYMHGYILCAIVGLLMIVICHLVTKNYTRVRLRVFWFCMISSIAWSVCVVEFAYYAILQTYRWISDEETPHELHPFEGEIRELTADEIDVDELISQGRPSA